MLSRNSKPVRLRLKSIIHVVSSGSRRIASGTNRTTPPMAMIGGSTTATTASRDSISLMLKSQIACENSRVNSTSRGEHYPRTSQEKGHLRR